MDSAMRTVLREKGTLKKSNRFGKTTFFKTLLLLGISLTFSSAFAQQKTINTAEMQQKLTEVNEKLQVVEEKIAQINYRLTGIPPENVDPQIQQRLNDLEIKKNQYSREKTSIEAVLNTSPNGSNSNDSFEPSSLKTNQDNSLMFSNPNEHTKNQ